MPVCWVFQEDDWPPSSTWKVGCLYSCLVSLMSFGSILIRSIASKSAVWSILSNAFSQSNAISCMLWSRMVRLSLVLRSPISISLRMTCMACCVLLLLLNPYCVLCRYLSMVLAILDFRMAANIFVTVFSSEIGL
mgnify:CR=1 FL=1